MSKEIIMMIICCLLLAASMFVYFYALIALKGKARKLNDYMREQDVKWTKYSLTVKAVDEANDTIMDQLEKVLDHDRMVLRETADLRQETQQVNARAEILIKEIRHGSDRTGQGSDDSAE